MLTARAAVAALQQRLVAAAEPPERDFIPLATEIMVTPASPIGLKLIVALSTLLFIALLAACLARIDIYAVATAKIQPTGRSKVIQALETSKVLSVHVADGAIVREGDLLIELDPTDTEADRETYAAEVDALNGEIVRRKAAIVAARTPGSLSIGQINFAPETTAATQTREQAVLAAELSRLQASLTSFDAQIAERAAREKALQMTLTEHQKLVDSLQQRVEMHKEIQRTGLESKVTLMTAVENLEQALTTLANLKGDILTTNASVDSIRTQKNDTVAKFLQDNTEALESAEIRQTTLAKSLVKASARYNRTRLLAPVAGAVQELVVTTVGQVVAPGQQLMTIVPSKTPIEAQALVENKDIGFVEPGQRVVMKIETFPFTRYGTISGKVSWVSREAVDQQWSAAPPEVAAPANNPDGTSSEGAAIATTHHLVYPVGIALDRSSMRIDGSDIPLISGMRATAEIQTGTRPVIDYFLSPVREVASDAAHER